MQIERLGSIIKAMSFTGDFIRSFASTLEDLDLEKVESFVETLSEAKKNKGRVFVVGVGGSAANASHMVNDLRKLVGIESYSASENVAELTARTNDEGWDSSFSEWLRVSKPSEKDVLCVLSVGGGSLERGLSLNIVQSIQLAQKVKMKIIGIVGKRDGFLGSLNLDGVVIATSENPRLLTPFAESVQQVIWHLAVSHPRLEPKMPTW